MRGAKVLGEYLTETVRNNQNEADSMDKTRQVVDATIVVNDNGEERGKGRSLATLGMTKNVVGLVFGRWPHTREHSVWIGGCCLEQKTRSNDCGGVGVLRLAVARGSGSLRMTPKKQISRGARDDAETQIPRFARDDAEKADPPRRAG